MAEARALILSGYGLNCERETAAGFYLAGAEAVIVHLNELISGAADLNKFDIVVLPGGFSFGDELGSGTVLANIFENNYTNEGYSLLEHLKRFACLGNYILGICNGFQAMLKMGLLPFPAGANEEISASMARNGSGKFEDRWCRFSVGKSIISPFFKGIDHIELPVRHAEGRLTFKTGAVKDRIVTNGLNCLTYCDDKWETARNYPQNPGGSELACAALTDETGRVLGMMPHPEAYLSLYNNPAWPTLKRQDPDISEEGEGLKIFKNIVRHIKENKN
jgi:phosphoribosylformylglycinamidine synthase